MLFAIAVTTWPQCGRGSPEWVEPTRTAEPGGRPCPSATATSPACPAGSTPTSPTRRRAAVLRRAVRVGVRERHARRMPAAATTSAASAAVTSRRSGRSPDGAPPMADVEHLHLGRRRRRDRGEGRATPAARCSRSRSTSMDAGRMAVLADPEGAVFCVWQAKEHRGAKVVNEHGALNFNGLATRDPRARRRSTARCSGGRCCRLPAGPMWMLPGYGDHLEERTPGPARADGADGRARRLHRRRRRRSTRSPTATPTRRRTGTSRSPSTTSTPPRPRPTELGGEVAGRAVDAPVDAAWPSSRIRRERCSSPSQFVPRTPPTA